MRDELVDFHFIDYLKPDFGTKLSKAIHLSVERMEIYIQLTDPDHTMLSGNHYSEGETQRYLKNKVADEIEVTEMRIDKSNGTVSVTINPKNGS